MTLRIPSLFVFTLLLILGSTYALERNSSDDPTAPSTPGIELTKLEDGGYRLTAKNVTVKALIDHVAAQTGVAIETDEALANQVVSVDETHGDLEALIQSISDSNAIVFERQGDEIRLVSAFVTSQQEEIVPAAVEAPELADDDGAAPRLVMGYKLTNLRSKDEAGKLNKQHVLALRNALIDTTRARRGVGIQVPAALQAREDARWHIVQFDGKVTDAARKALEDAGFKIGHYVPMNAVAVQADPSRLDQLRNLPGVYHVEAYHPYLKVSGDILGYLSGEAPDEVKSKVEAGQITMLTQPHEGDLSGIAGLAEIESESLLDGRKMIRATATPDALVALAQQDAVQWMEVTPVFKPMNDLGNQRLRANAIKRRLPSLTGTGVVVAVTDSGIDFTHPDFALNPESPTGNGLNSRVVRYENRPSITSDGFPGDTDGHGTHVAGSILGNGYLSTSVISAPGSKGPPYTNLFGRQFAGIAPGAKAVIIEDFNSFTPAEQVSIAWSNQARIANNSWGASVYEYTADSAAWDALVRDALPGVFGQQEFTAFFAAGNDGGGTPDGLNGEAATIGIPANAKNVITIGALEQPRLAENLTAFASRERSDSDWQVADFSSRGPVDVDDDATQLDDVRTKPDLVAPGVYVLSTQSRETNPDVLNEPFDIQWDYRSGNIDSGTNYAFFSGTSMASPLAAGVGALYIEYYKNTFGKNPSPAMVKAALVGGARNVNTLIYKHPESPAIITRTVDQGWGLIDGARSIFGTGIHPTDQLIIVDQEAALTTGQFYSRQITVNPGEGGLKIVLAWTDAPGNPAIERQLVNNLDLLVLAPGGGGYVGNRFAENGVHSERFILASPDEGDPYNNVEVILIPEATPGTYTIRAYGNDVPQGPQDFAMFIMKGVGQERRFEGNKAAIAIDNKGRPHVAFSGLDTAGSRQVFVKQWRGDMGDLSDFGNWRRLEDNWFSLNKSASSVGISQSLEESDNPSIAVTNNNIYVAWVHRASNGTNIYLRWYNGTNWSSLGASASGLGISSNTTFAAAQPVVRLDTNGYPVVAWLQSFLANRKVNVARWNGSAWVGYGTSLTNGFGDANQAANISLTINSAGNPVVAWEELTTQRIHVWQWNGAAWGNLGQRGSLPFAGNPHLDAAPNGDLFLTWMQITGVAPPSPYQIYAERRTGGSWVSMAGSGSSPGVSAETNLLSQVYAPNIAYSPRPTPRVFVSWLQRTDSNTAVHVKQHILGSGSWTGISGSDKYPGVAVLPGSSTNAVMGATSMGVPVVAFENDGAAAIREVVTYGLVSDIVAPTFAGISTAVGGTNGDVRLSWNISTDNLTVSTNMRYHIYMGTNRYPCFEVPSCSPTDVFTNRIAVVTNITSFTVTNLAPYELRCFAVRAVDGADNEEQNIKILYAGPELSGTSCLNRDTNGNGIPDWWEYTWFGSITGAFPNVTNVVGGLSNLDAYLNGTDPFSGDSDADDVSDWNEVYVHKTLPAVADSDADGLNDGLELAINANPRHFDSNGNGVADGAMYGLGYHPTQAVEVLNRVFIETFEGSSTSRAAWAKSTPNAAFPYNFWHFSTAQPVTLSTNIIRENMPSTNTAFRLATDLTATNPMAVYAVATNAIIAGIVSPPINAAALNNLHVSWKEYFVTEDNSDFILVQARSAAKTNWIVVREALSGKSDGWNKAQADLSVFAGDTGVQVRFLFTANNINNQHAGWYVDDVVFYSGLIVGGGTNGWVRSIDGEPVLGAEVSAIGINVVTNPVDGHRVTLPGRVFGSALTRADGSYVLSGLPLGKYFLKVAHPQYRTEFWNGQLMTAGGYQFGNQLNAGVALITNAAPGGVLDLTAGGPAPAVQFEIEPGDPRSFIGASSVVSLPLNVNFIHDIQGWNGATGGAAALVSLTTETNAQLAFNNADYDNNPVKPNFITDIGPGNQLIGLGTNFWRIPSANLPSRAGEFGHVRLATNSGNGFMQVASLDGVSRPIYLNGVRTALTTPALIKLQSGHHLVQIAGDGEFLLPGKQVYVPIGIRTNVAFTVAELNGAGDTGTLVIEAQASDGSLVTNASVYVQGRLLTTNSAVGLTRSITPVTLPGLVPGFYAVSVAKPGYNYSQIGYYRVGAGETTYVRVNMAEADIDFDGVGDATEIAAFTNLLAYSGSDDPDGDQLTNKDEFEIGRIYGVTLDPLQADTDADGATDGQEIGYDGFAKVGSHVMYATTRLATNAVEGADRIRTIFVGRFLEGIWNFGTNPVLAASINGDRIVATNVTHVPPALPSARAVETVLQGMTPYVASEAISQGHPLDTIVYADSDPNLVDTDGDDMWDGFEIAYRWMTNGFGIVQQILDPISVGGRESDDDADGLANLNEFYGPDLLSNTNDWTDPRIGDTDGDSMPDGWEYFYGFNPRDSSDAGLDFDGDVLSNAQEYSSGTNPKLADSDGDDLSDGLEVLIYGTNPNKADTDGDGLFDGLEVTLSTNPLHPDTDGDGMPDGFEVLDMFGNLRPIEARLNPLDPSDAALDFDLDGLTNLEEYQVRDAASGNHPSSFPSFNYVWYGSVPVGWNFDITPFHYQFPVWDYSTDPFNSDTDGDGLPDGYEAANGLHPIDPLNINSNTVVRYPPLGRDGDPDFDGLWNELEYRIRFAIDSNAPVNLVNSANTHPWISDTDNDGLDDGEEHHTMHLGNPLRQDTDGDGLTDGSGIEEKYGEVESSLRRRFDVIPCTGCTWQTAAVLAQFVSHPDDATAFGHLATIGNAREFSEVLTALEGYTGTNIAIGAWAPDPATNVFFNIAGAQLEPFIFHNFGTNLPVRVPDVTNGLVVNPAGQFHALDITAPTIDAFVVEWPDTRLVTNHYDGAYNDLWTLTFASDAGLGAPVWRRVTVDTNSLLPEPRWGHAMTFIPGYEIKDQRDGKDGTLSDGTHFLMDNRKLVVIGGNSGVEKFADIWEYWIKSNSWSRSVVSLTDAANQNLFAPEMASGLSDLSAVLLMGYSNTKDPTPLNRNVSWSNSGISFGEPKDRPWDRGYQDSSYDLTYILGGWNDDHWYGWNEPMNTIYYKSTDDRNLILEESRAYNNNIRSYDVWQSTETRNNYNTNGSLISVINNASRTYADLSARQDERLNLEDGGDDERVPLGFFEAPQTVVTNNDAVLGLLVTTTFPFNVATAIRIEKFPFKIPYDSIVTANLVIAISRAPTNDLDLYMVSEYNRLAPNDDPLSEEYSWNEDEQTVPSGTPLQRANGRSFVSSRIGFTIPAGFTGDWPIDVTSILQEVADEFDWEGRAIGFVMTVPTSNVVSRIARFDGVAWSGLQSGINGTVLSLEADTFGGLLYAGGVFTNAGGLGITNIAAWNGMEWSPVGGGLNGAVRALAEDGAGGVFVGGSFTNSASGVTNVAYWSGTNWVNIGSINGTVHALHFDPSFGYLYVGGQFTLAGGVGATNIALWDGATWYSLGDGTDGPVYAVDAFDGTPFVFAGGAFTTMDGVPAANVAQFNFVAWSGLSNGVNGTVRALDFNPFAGQLIVGGNFTDASGLPAANIAAFNGIEWSGFSNGVNGEVRSLTLGASGDVIAGGDFTDASGVLVNYVAQWDGAAWSRLERGFDGAVNAVAYDGSDVYAAGLFGNTIGETDGAVMKENSAFIRIWHDPSYRVEPQWHVGTRFQTVQGEVPSKRKSFGMSYNWRDNRIIVFGGMNGRGVLDETYEGEPVFGEEDEELEVGSAPSANEDVRKVRWVRWQRILSDVRPPARWGHAQIYDDVNNRVIVFGGFDKNNRPLNDLWAYTLASTVTNSIENEDGSVSNEVVVTAGGWQEINDFQDSQRPSPRGGAAMAWVGGQFYRDSSGRYGISGARRKLVLFGGTDGKNYFNDTWYFDEREVNYDIQTTIPNRWVLADPGGEQSPGPEPRAFAQMAMAQNAPIAPAPFVNIFDGTNIVVVPPRGPFQILDGDTIVRDGPVTIWMFGGRRGTLVSGPDSDRDLVDDGVEHALGGTNSGRDPRVNALWRSLNTNETIPFVYQRLGNWGGFLPGFVRPAVADLEAISYHERVHGWRMGNQYTGIFLPWQGHPLETTYQSQYYEVGNETDWPVDRPDTNRLVYLTGIDALSADWINMWFHRHGEGDPQDPRDVWELGVPYALSGSPNSAPPYARSGRWVYGTGLNSSYPSDARMELYSPVFSLARPSVNATETNNNNSFFLVFHEWLDLADANDVVRVDVIRPTTPADLYVRQTGADKQTVTILPNRNFAYNTTGEWRRVVVPLDSLGNESNLYFRFTMETDEQGTAGGWYLDDVAIAQGYELFGTNTVALTNVFLLGVNSGMILDYVVAGADGRYAFGFLPKGTYMVQTSSGLSGPYSLPLPIVPEVDYDIVGMLGVNTVSWEAIIGATYQVQYTDDLLSGIWTDLGLPIVAAVDPESIVDPLPPGVTRFYRILLVSVP